MKKTALPFFFGAAFIATIAFSPTAYSISKKIRSPYVTEGKWEIEHYGDYSFDAHSNKNTDTKTGISYSPTRFWNIEIEGIADKTAGHGFKYKGTEISNKFQLTEQGAYIIDVGLSTAYTFATSPARADEIEATLLLGKTLNRWKHYAKIQFEREVGENGNDAVNAAFGIHSSAKITDALKSGVEYYGDFGAVDNMESFAKQEHQFGPVVALDVPNTQLEMRLGYLFGLSSASPDGTVTWLVAFDF